MSSKHNAFVVCIATLTCISVTGCSFFGSSGKSTDYRSSPLSAFIPVSIRRALSPRSLPLPIPIAFEDIVKRNDSINNNSNIRSINSNMDQKVEVVAAQQRLLEYDSKKKISSLNLSEGVDTLLLGSGEDPNLRRNLPRRGTWSEGDAPVSGSVSSSSSGVGGGMQIPKETRVKQMSPLLTCVESESEVGIPQLDGEHEFHDAGSVDVGQDSGKLVRKK